MEHTAHKKKDVTLLMIVMVPRAGDCLLLAKRRVHMIAELFFTNENITKGPSIKDVSLKMEGGGYP